MWNIGTLSMLDPSYSYAEDIMGVLRICRGLDRLMSVTFCLKYEINLEFGDEQLQMRCHLVICMSLASDMVTSTSWGVLWNLMAGCRSEFLNLLFGN